MIKGHGGNIHELAATLGCLPSEIVDMSSNVNPFGPPPGLTSHLAGHLDGVTALPEVDAGNIRRLFAQRHGVDPSRVLAGNGTTQFIYSLPRALNSRQVMILAPTYADYADACRMNNVPFAFLAVDAAAAFVHDPGRVSKALADSKADTIFICNPNNPTGVFIPPQALLDLCRRHPDVRFIIDESYLGFVPQAHELSLINVDVPENAIVLNSMSKVFSIPGLRIGFVYSSQPVIDRLAAFNLPWCVNSLSQTAVAWLMDNPDVVDGFVAETVTRLASEKAFLSQQIEAVSGIRLFPSVASFLLASLEPEGNARELCSYVGRHRILIRNCENFYGLSSKYVRFSLKTHANNAELVNVLNYYFNDRRPE